MFYAFISEKTLILMKKNLWFCLILLWFRQVSLLIFSCFVHHYLKNPHFNTKIYNFLMFHIFLILYRQL